MRFLCITYSDYKRVENIILVGITPQWGCTVSNDTHSYKRSLVRNYLEDGKEPLPITTAIRHERPWKDREDPDQPFKELDHSAIEHKAAADV
jgi:hypothetical protein